MKRYLRIGLVTLLVTLALVAPATAAPPTEFYLQKVCSDVTVNYCTLQNAGPGPWAALNGGRVYYNGPILGNVNPHGFMWVSSDVHLVGPDGSSLDGHFTFVGDHGYLTLDQGTGQLAGVHAQGIIGVLSWEQAIYSLSGSYFVTP